MLQGNGLEATLPEQGIGVPVGIIRDKQLAGVDFCVALFKWTHQVACNLKEVAIVTGYHYGQVRRWELPLFDGKITRSEFIAWKRKKMAEKRSNQAQTEPVFADDRPVGPATAARQRRSAATNFEQ